jgi:hypothetical protein
MPSRKKAKGKARKAAKEAKAKEEEDRAGFIPRSADRLLISAAFPTHCWHGYPPLPTGEEDICRDFIGDFITAFISQDVVDEFVTAHRVTGEKYADVYASKLDSVISMLLASGTKMILGGNNKQAQMNAMLTCYFEEWVAVQVHETKAVPNRAKINELRFADDRTLVSFYRKRIPCSCLDERYEEVKSVKKMGCCYNPNCIHAFGTVERRKMLFCTRCGEANYCSVECQRADWKTHRVRCNKIVEAKAEFSSNETKNCC